VPNSFKALCQNQRAKQNREKERFAQNKLPMSEKPPTSGNQTYEHEN